MKHVRSMKQNEAELSKANQLQLLEMQLKQMEIEDFEEAHRGRADEAALIKRKRIVSSSGGCSHTKERSDLFTAESSLKSKGRKSTKFTLLQYALPAAALL